MISFAEKKRNREIIELVRQAIADDKQRRQQFKVGDKYSFISENLNSILRNLEANLDVSEQAEAVQLPPWHRELADNERVVYIYLYNAQGKNPKVWQQLLSRKSMNEYSFSRPIYTKREHVEKILKSRDHCANHAFISVVVKKNHIIDSPLTDNFGNPRVRLLEGSLDADNIVEFVHREREYYRDSRARLLLKSEQSA